MQANFDPVTFNMMLNMMNVMYPNMGFDINNYNNNMYNNQVLMNMMMNMMNQNSFLQQMYNNMSMNNMNQNQNNNHIQFTNYNPNQTNPNAGGTFSANNQSGTYDPYPNSNNKINISFTTQKGNKIIIVIPRELPVKDLLVKYVLRMGLGPGVLKNKLFFVYNGLRVNNYEEKAVGDFFGFSGTNIIVMDTENIIGALI